MTTKTTKTTPALQPAGGRPAAYDRGRVYNLAYLRACGVSGAWLRWAFKNGLPYMTLAKQKLILGDDLVEFLLKSRRSQKPADNGASQC